MLNNYKKCLHDPCTLSKDALGHEVLSYGEPEYIVASISPITKELQNLVPNYSREVTYYLIKTRNSVAINDKVDGKSIIKHIRGEYYVAI